MKTMQQQIDAQQKEIEDLRGAKTVKLFAKSYVKILLLLAALVLIAGSAGAFGYYKVLKSIIDQFPQ